MKLGFLEKFIVNNPIRTVIQRFGLGIGALLLSEKISLIEVIGVGFTIAAIGAVSLSGPGKESGREGGARGV